MNKAYKDVYKFGITNKDNAYCFLLFLFKIIKKKGMVKKLIEINKNKFRAVPFNNIYTQYVINDFGQRCIACFWTDKSNSFYSYYSSLLLEGISNYHCHVTHSASVLLK